MSKYEKLNFTPPDAVANAAKKGLELRAKYKRGGMTRQEASKEKIGSGIQRAVNLKNKNKLSPETVKRMYNYFNRHQSDNLNEDGTNGKPPSNGYIAWMLWGGDSGRSWATKLVNQMKKIDESIKKKKISIKKKK